MALPEKTIGFNYGRLTTVGRELLDKKQQKEKEEKVKQLPSTVEDRTASTVEVMSPSTVEDRTASTVEVMSPSTVEVVSPSTVEGRDLWTVEGGEGVFTRSRLRRITVAQDALTHVEESVYDALWGVKKKAEQETHRLAQMGYSELAKKSRVSKRTIQSIVDRLIQKNFIQIEVPADILRRQPTVYKVLGYAAILKHQRDTGRQWVIQTGRGIFYAQKLSSTVEARLPSTVEVRSPSTVEASSTSTVELPSTVLLIGNKEGITSSSGTAIVQRAIAKHIAIDDDAVLQIIQGCQRNDPDCTLEEIAEFSAHSAAKIRRQKNVGNPAGLLINQAPRFFPGTELTAYRARKAQEIAKAREMARRVLENPEASPQELEWAKTMIPDGRPAENEG
jgi:DNA-binding MarR family transcriptional regulator